MIEDVLGCRSRINVLKLLAKHPNLTQSQIIKRLNYKDKQAMRRYLKILTDADILTCKKINNNRLYGYSGSETAKKVLEVINLDWST